MFRPTSRSSRHSVHFRAREAVELSDGPSRQRELLLVVLDHLLALCLRQVIRVTDRVYSAAASPMKLIFPSAGPTDRC